MTFSSKDVEPMNIPYDRFTTLCKTRHALLFLFGKSWCCGRRSSS